MIDRWKWAAIALAGVALLLLSLLVVAHFRLSSAESIIEEYAVAELPKRGFGKGEWKQPSMPDAPLGTKPLAKVVGTVVYKPILGAAATDSPSSQIPIPPGTPSGPQPCDLNSLDITINCAADILATPSDPWARILTSGVVKGYGQVRNLPERPAGRIHLQVDPVAAVKPLMWEFRAGLGLPGPSVNVGFTRMLNRRLGVYGAVAAPISGAENFSLEAGLAFRF